MDKYEKLEKVGEGTYGKVYKARVAATGQLVALKKTRLEMDEEGIPPTALREISLLRLLSASLYVVRLLSVEQVTKPCGKTVLYLVFEFLDTDLKKFVDGFRKGPSPRPLPTQVVKVYLSTISFATTTFFFSILYYHLVAYRFLVTFPRKSATLMRGGFATIKTNRSVHLDLQYYNLVKW
uniref:[RNA-polymerase]-subunit kinase n=1 Tax=Aegilops tauschii subsp. strangulata TaxID=200361 RepID=A0A453KCM0_AEGTS